MLNCHVGFFASSGTIIEVEIEIDRPSLGFLGIKQGVKIPGLVNIQKAIENGDLVRGFTH